MVNERIYVERSALFMRTQPMNVTAHVNAAAWKG